MRREEKYREPELSGKATRDTALLILTMVLLVVAAALVFVAIGYIDDDPQARSEPQFELDLDCESCIKA